VITLNDAMILTEASNFFVSFMSHNQAPQTVITSCSRH